MTNKLAATVAIAFVLALSLAAHTLKSPRDPNKGWTVTAYPFGEEVHGDWQIVKLSTTPVD